MCACMVIFLVYIFDEKTSDSNVNEHVQGPAIAAGHYRHIWVYFTAPFVGALIGKTFFFIYC